MRIGIPRERKVLEGRVALIPQACAALVRAGHRVCVEADAGKASGYQDRDYLDAGVELAADPEFLYGFAELVVKVKEPLPEEYPRLRPDHRLFCFLHLAASSQLTRALLDIGLTAIGFETVEEGGRLPLLAPMSRIAGTLAAQIGTHLLHTPQGGKGVLLGGLPGTPRGRVVVLGAGVAGSAAAGVAAALGAEVLVFDRIPEKLDAVRGIGANVTGLFPYPRDLADAVASADLLVGAVLLPGAQTPRLVDRAMVRGMQPGSVIIDISVDQGGCIESIRPTTYADPVYVDEGVLHFGVTNMPGAVPRSASQALSAVLTPYVLALADPGWREASPALRKGINLEAGKVLHPALIGLEKDR